MAWKLCFCLHTFFSGKGKDRTCQMGFGDFHNRQHYFSYATPPVNSEQTQQWLSKEDNNATYSLNRAHFQLCKISHRHSPLPLIVTRGQFSRAHVYEHFAPGWPAAFCLQGWDTCSHLIWHKSNESGPAVAAQKRVRSIVRRSRVKTSVTRQTGAGFQESKTGCDLWVGRRSLSRTLVSITATPANL